MLTYNSSFTSSQVDAANTKAAGFKWYPWSFFSGSTGLAAIVLNADGSVTLNGDTSGPNGEIATVVDKGSGTFHGTAFGGGFYIEGILKFNPTDVINQSFVGFPSFWSMAIEQLVPGSGVNQWPGQTAGFKHFAELDFLEYGLSQYVPSVGNNFILCGYHDWYGSAGTSQFQLPNSQVYTEVFPSNFDFTQYHKYGCLWVPATASTRGYVKFFVDDVQVGSVFSWSLYTGEAFPPAAVFTYSPVNEDFGWQGNNIRQVLAPALLGASTGGKIRVTFQTYSGGVGTLDSAWVGESAPTGNESNYDGNQVQLTFDNGHASTVLNPGALVSPNAYNTVTSDWVPFSYDSSKKLVIAVHVTGSDVHFTQQTGLTGATIYSGVARHASFNNPQVDNGGATAPNLANTTATTCLVAKVEVQDYTTFSIVDSQHLVPILGTGVNEPMTVKSMRVWQASASGNLTG
ncbi:MULTISPECIES: hypothetical protein [unclassified Bradyrhizobium]|uniref:hypothetical protein n=1 Tax=unclassified Bradyrhizobium TaxID=2631580 RepID=UPI003392DE22